MLLRRLQKWRKGCCGELPHPDARFGNVQWNCRPPTKRSRYSGRLGRRGSRCMCWRRCWRWWKNLCVVSERTRQATSCSDWLLSKQARRKSNRQVRGGACTAPSRAIIIHFPACDGLGDIDRGNRHHRSLVCRTHAMRLRPRALEVPPWWPTSSCVPR